MARSTSNVIWVVVIAALVFLALGAALWGPRLYREGRAFVTPIAELAGAEKAMDALDEEFPFDPPADGLVREDRLLVFLDVSESLGSRYAEWQELVNEMEGGRAQSWQQAKDALAATRDVLREQQDTLRAHRISPSELVWLEDAVLSWWRQVEAQMSDAHRPAVVAAVRQAGEEDLDRLAELEQRYGRLEAVDEMRRHIERRLAALDSPAPPEAAGTLEENQRLFWRHREPIASVAQASHNPLHEMIRERGSVRIDIDDDGRPSFLPKPETTGER